MHKMFDLEERGDLYFFKDLILEGEQNQLPERKYLQELEF